MTKKQLSPEADTQEAPEELEVQVRNAMSRKKGLPAHVETGKKVQAAGTAAQKAKGYASQREKALETERKKNDRLERLAKIEEAEEAERERGARLADVKGKKAQAPSTEDRAEDATTGFDSRLAKIEELLMARQQEAQEAPPKRKRKAAPRRQVEVEETDDEDEPPRQKHVRKSAKSELRKKAGAYEEGLNNRSNIMGNTGKQRAMEHDQEARYRAMAQNLMPGLFQ